MKDKIERIMELKEGMYVRTNNGIAKIKAINNDFLLLDKIPQSTFKNNVIKASNNIIDLIEVGDYVNGCRAHRIANCIKIILDNEENISWINPNEIKSIVTKEQFESMSYKVIE